MSESKKRKESEEPTRSSFKAIGIFGGSCIGKDGDFFKAASELGQALAARRINVAYGGGTQGLKGCTATTAALRGSKVLGILLKGLDDKNFVAGTELRVSSLTERMRGLFTNAEAYIALPGGLETLDGISTIMYWAKINLHQKPLGLLNINGFYDGLLLFLDHAVQQGFISQVNRQAIMSASTADQLIDQLQAYVHALTPPAKQISWQSPESSKKDEPDTTLRL